ncbi:TMAO reductase system periplasmic protein TorT, partial [Escherichia coli]
MRVLLFLLLSLFMLSAFSADNLLRWHDAQHYTVQASTPLKAKRAWKLCALYPSLKDSYWLSLNYGMQEAARRYGVDLKVLEAGGYSQLATQQAQIDQCKQWGAEAILLGSSTTSFPDLQKQVANLPVIELVNAIDAPQVKSRVGVPWFQMGYQPGRYLVQWSHGKPLNVLLMPGPDNAGGSKEMVEGFRAAIAGSPVRIVDIALGDNDIEIQRNLLQEMLERHPEIDVVAGTAIAAEAAMGEGRNLKTPLTVVWLVFLQWGVDVGVWGCLFYLCTHKKTIVNGTRLS